MAMCLFNTPSVPQVKMPPPPAAEPAPSPQASDPAAIAATTKNKQQRLKASGQNNTLVTGGAGLTAPANTATKNLYGV